MDWQNHAKCDGLDTQLFYPKRDNDYVKQAAAARAVCLGGKDSGPRCPVIRECLLYALVMPDQHGVWGGMSSRERKTLHKRRELPDYVTWEDLEELGLVKVEAAC